MLVSIITAFYNGTEYLSGLLQSIQANALKCHEYGISIEHIIVNDSPDCELVIDAAEYDFDVRIHVNEQNRGIHASRIAGFEMAAGEYLIFLDQDDTLEPEAVCSHLDVMVKKNAGNNHRKRETANGVVTGVAPAVSVGNGYFVNQKNSRRTAIYKNIWYHSLSNRLHTMIKYGTVIISPGQCMIRKSAVPKVWLANPVRTNGADDELLWLAMLSEGCFFAVNRSYVYNHLETGKNTSDNIGQIAESSLEGMQLLKQCPGFTNNQLKLYSRRRQMKKDRYQKSFGKRVWINVKNPDLSLYIIGVKLLKQLP